MTTTCLPQTTVAAAAATTTATTTIGGPDDSASAARGTAGTDRLRTAVVTLIALARQRSGARSGPRTARHTPSQAALESIESFPGLHR